MAKTSNITILQYGDNKIDIWNLPKSSAADVFAKGDLCETDGSDAVQVVDSAENPTFLGISEVGSQAGDTENIVMLLKCIFKGTMAAAQAGSPGRAVLWAAGANGTNWTFTDGAAEGIAWSLETIATAGSGRMLNDVRRIDTGFFEVMTT